MTSRRTKSIISYTNHTKKGAEDMERPDGYYAWTATVGEKGQIVIPKQARDLFEIKPGDTLLILGDKNQGLAIPPKGAFKDIFKVAFPENGDGGTDR